MKVLRICLNPRVVAALIVVGGAVLVFTPSLAATALPLLILAACPLSMLLMGGAMIRSRGLDASGGRAVGSLADSPSGEASVLGAEAEPLQTQTVLGVPRDS